MIEVKIEPFSVKHIEQVTIIESQIFLDEPWSCKSFESELDSPYSKCFVAVMEDSVVGYIMAECIFENATINNIAVAEKFRNKGIAKMLIQHFIKTACECEAKQITLEVRQSNKTAVSVYKNFGFKTVGVRKRFYVKPVEDADLMLLSI